MRYLHVYYFLYFTVRLLLEHVIILVVLFTCQFTDYITLF